MLPSASTILHIKFNKIRQLKIRRRWSPTKSDIDRAFDKSMLSPNTKILFYSLNHRSFKFSENYFTYTMFNLYWEESTCLT
jgi:hypothetical protein